MKKISKKNLSIQLLMTLISLIAYTIFTSVINYLEVSYIYNCEKLLFLMSWVGVIILFYCIYSWYVITKTLFCPYIIFLSFLAFFNFGQCLMWSIGVHSYNEIGKIAMYEALPPPTSIQILKAQLYVCLCILFFHLGALLCYKPKNNIIKKSNNKEIYYVVIYKISILIAIIAIPITLYRGIILLKHAIQYGYASLYYSDTINTSGITMIIEIFFFPSLIGLLIGSKYKKGVVRNVYLIFAIYLLINLLQGDRGSWIYKIITLVWLSHSFNKKINFKRAIKLIGLSIISLYCVYALMELRGKGLSNVSFEDIKNAFDLKNSPIVSALFEMGNSMTIMIILLSVGSGIWPYSNSYFVAIAGLPTTRILKPLGLDLVLIDNWFSQDYLGINWGAGFSMIGEAFLNYGFYLAPLILIIIGYFIGSVLYIKNNDSIMNHPLKYFFVATSLASLIGWSRGSSLMFLRNWFRGTVLIVFIVLIIVAYSKKVSK